MSDEPQDVTIDGTIERVTFKNDESGFMVARFLTSAREQVTIVGEIVGVTEGLPLRLRGQWVVDRKFGKQFKVSTYQLESPKTVVGIERFLGSGLIPGIGPGLAKRIVQKFGAETLELIEKAPARLTEVVGISSKKAKKVAEAFAEQRHVQDVMVFLQGHGVSAAFAGRIVKKLGKNAVNLVRQNPYRLAHEIRGIGFMKADAIARELGLALDAPERLEAGLLHALETSHEDGHMHLPDDELVTAAGVLLKVATEGLPPRLAALELSGLVVREVLGARGACTALPSATRAESAAAVALAELVRTPGRGMGLDLHAAIDAFEKVTGVELAVEQRRAVQAALVDKLVVITGGPGVGKTTIIKAIVHLAKLVRRRVGLAAPTGRAAKRLREATVHDAVTIHRLLEFQPRGRGKSDAAAPTDGAVDGGFTRNRAQPLDLDMLVIDEASMVDTELFRALLEALPPRAQLVLVGDVDQLPSVGAGAVLADTIAAEAATVIRLTEIFRQAAQSKIVVSAHAINHGRLPDLDSPAGATSDFYFIARDDPQAARETIVELVAERIHARFGFDPITDVQVLAPMHRSELGTEALNSALQAKLNPPRGEAELVRGDRAFRRGDRLMQRENDYEKGVFNGDIGILAAVHPDAGTLEVDFDGRVATYERNELHQLVHAYAISIHKSQGSEYPAVVLALATQHFRMLQRSLLYTAVTRGKKLVVIVGSKRALGLAVRNADAKQRYTWMAERVKSLLSA